MNNKNIVKEKDIVIRDSYWWLGPVGVFFIILLIVFALFKNITPARLDDLPARAKKRLKNMIVPRTTAIWLDMQVSPISRDNAVEFGLSPKQRGVVVTDLNHGQGAGAGLNMGDVIVAINGKKVQDFESFLWLAKQSKFSNGILLDVITNGRRRYVSIPFLFEGGPLMGPNANHWQLGGPINSPAMGYGKLAAFTPGTGRPRGSFMICPNCGHSSTASAQAKILCPNCGIRMLRNQ